MNKFFTLTALTLSIPGFAMPQQETKSPKPEKNLRNPITLCEIQDNQGVNLGIRADLLYMNYTTPVLTFASDELTTAAITHSKILGVPGKMSLGWNIALNYTMPNQPGYTFESSWYHIVAKSNRKVTGDHVLLAHSVALTTPQPGTVAVNSHTTINFFDLLIQKNFGWGNWFSIMPSGGLVGGYMDSVNRANTRASSGSFGSGTTVAQLNQSILFEGIGLKLGGRSSFKIWEGFKLTADLFYSVMYGFSKAHLTYSSNGLFNGASGANITYKQHHARSFLDALIGLAWEQRFRNDSLFLELHAGWRFQSFENGIMGFEVELNNSLSSLPLYGQGLQAGATFKF